MDNHEQFDDEEFDRVCKRMAEAARNSADALRRLQSAFAVVGYELRELIDAHPKNIGRETPAKEMGEATLARASSKKA